MNRQPEDEDHEAHWDYHRRPGPNGRDEEGRIYDDGTYQRKPSPPRPPRR
jgi:hypothetical protein